MADEVEPVSQRVIISSLAILTPLTLLSTFILYQLCFNLYCKQSASPEQEEIRSRMGSITSKSSTVLSRSTSNSNTKTKRKRHKSQIEPFFKYTTISASSVFFMVCVFINIDRILSNQPYWSILFGAIAVFIFYFIGRMILTLNFIGRLHYTFAGSVYAKSQFTMRSLKLSWCFMPLFSVLSFLMYPLIPMLCYAFGSVVILCDMILSVVLLALYMKTLTALVNGNSANQNTNVISFMIRYTLLYSISFATTFLWIVIAIGSTFVLNVEGEEVLRFLWIFTSFDALFNSLSLWLNLQFANVWYFRLCSCGHNVCKLCFKHYHTADAKMLMRQQSVRSAKSRMNSQKSKTGSGNNTIASVEMDTTSGKQVETP